MSKLRMCPALQPRQRRAAKKVIADSWAPVSSMSSTSVSSATRASTAWPFCASRMAEVQKESMSSAGDGRRSGLPPR